MKITLLAAIGVGVGLFAGSAVGAVRTEKVLVAAKDSVAAAQTAAHADAAKADEVAETVTLPPDETTAADTAHGPAAREAVATPHTTPDVTPDAPPAVAAPAEAPRPAAVTEASSQGPADSAAAKDSTHAARTDSLSALDPDGAKKLAKIFSAMKAPAAAAVLVEMSDAEVTAILLRMSDRQAGPIVGAFPPDRAASLGRVVLRGQEGGI